MRVTIKDVAREAGVSVSTVSYALNKKGEPVKESHKRVIEAAERLGYVPDATARSLVNSRTNSIGVVICTQKKDGEYNPYEVELIASFSAELARRGNWMCLYLDNGKDDAILEKLIIDAKVDGIVWTGGGIPDKVRRVINVRNLPCIVVLSKVAGDMEIANVQISSAQGIREAIGHLVSLGHRDILDVSSIPGNSRERAFKSSLEEFGIHEVRQMFCHFDENLAYDEMKKLIESEEKLPTAVFAENDNMAIGVMRAVKDAGLRVPQDISVIGYDDIQAARRTDPPLTTIRQDLEEVARLACDYLIECRDSKEQIAPISKDVATRLILRKSTGPARE